MKWDGAWKMVKCKDCHLTYQCTPQADYYNATCATDGVCESCLLKAHGLDPLKVIEVGGNPCRN